MIVFGKICGNSGIKTSRMSTLRILLLYNAIPSHLGRMYETQSACLFNKLLNIQQPACFERQPTIAPTETWLTPDVYGAEISIDGYKFFPADSKNGREAGRCDDREAYLHKIDQQSGLLASPASRRSLIGRKPGANIQTQRNIDRLPVANAASRGRQNSQNVVAARSLYTTRCTNENDVCTLHIDKVFVRYLETGVQKTDLITSYLSKALLINLNIMDVVQLFHKTNFIRRFGSDEAYLSVQKVASAKHFHLFSQSLTKGNPPSAWNEAIVTCQGICWPLTAGSYTPISFARLPCKVVERNSLISPVYQCFPLDRSCATNILVFMDSLTKAGGKGLISDARFLD
ncbi:hypothetical protein CLF_111385 [Clonorchis sinensis]|uniref:Uncharacterized protein n=1 Tax=Clonorchis sinensis TaxID=79923 RepID=G7YUS1_CLOSI|nr:hypothetical protein CLF_111385 [Clonorchis sinensis]